MTNDSVEMLRAAASALHEAIGEYLKRPEVRAAPPFYREWQDLGDELAKATLSRVPAEAPEPCEDVHRVVEAPEPERCDYCDGVGWYEGGKVLQTFCEKCNGTGVRAARPSGEGSSERRELMTGPSAARPSEPAIEAAVQAEAAAHGGLNWARGRQYGVARAMLEAAYQVDFPAGDAPQQIANELALVAKMGDTLKAHFPALMPNGDIICACAAVFHPVDAKAWHRHAASMIANTIAENT